MKPYSRYRIPTSGILAEVQVYAVLGGYTLRLPEPSFLGFEDIWVEGFLDVFCGDSLQVGGVTTRKHLQWHHDSSMFYTMVGCLKSLVSIRYIMFDR